MEDLSFVVTSVGGIEMVDMSLTTTPVHPEWSKKGRTVRKGFSYTVSLCISLAMWACILLGLTGLWLKVFS